MAKMAETTKMAAEHVIITMAVNFPRRENLFRERMSVLCRGWRVAHDLCQRQKLGAEFQSGAISGVSIYEETDMVLFESELDDATRGGKVLIFADDENVLAPKL